jgi:NAD(P)-dependent dehydrogenase (short-subunit alcohol dehydrogenase family)
MMLENKVAIVYGGAGAIGTAVSTAFAREGATVHLVGRRLEPLDEVADQIRAAGGRAETASVDALDEQAVDAHAAAVVERSGRIDISFNLIDVRDVQGTPLVDMTWNDFEQPVTTALRSTFLTARAAARQMIRQRSGVILTFGGDGGRNPVRDYSIGGFVVALNAVDALRRQLAAELGRYGIRTVTLHTGGVLETLPADMPERDEITRLIVEPTMLKRTATLAEVGNVAAFAASDLAGPITAASINITCGATAD